MKTSRSSFALCAGALALAVAGPAQAQHHGTVPHGAQLHGTPAHAPSAYAGEQRREIKALSAQEQRAWLEGQGMGLARAAELNGYPGPMHVLELAAALQLSPQQESATRALMHEHKAEVRRLGAALVEAERRLDRLFGERRADDAAVDRLTGEIATLQARIRAAHLRTHLAQAALLQPQQVAQYQVLRGYAP